MAHNPLLSSPIALRQLTEGHFLTSSYLELTLNLLLVTSIDISGIDFLIAIEVLGTFAFAVSGATAAIRSRFDVFGIFVLAFVTAIGGGTIRDVLIGNTPVTWLTSTLAISSATAGFLFTTVVYSKLKKLEGWLFTFDAAGLGLFTVMGTQIGLEAGMGSGISIALGTITGCFGGVIRDVLSGDKPLIFQEEIYAMAAVTGGIIFVAILNFTEALLTAQIVAIITIILVRFIAVRYHLGLPRFSS